MKCTLVGTCVFENFVQVCLSSESDADPKVRREARLHGKWETGCACVCDVVRMCVVCVCHVVCAAV